MGLVAAQEALCSLALALPPHLEGALWRVRFQGSSASQQHSSEGGMRTDADSVYVSLHFEASPAVRLKGVRTTGS